MKRVLSFFLPSPLPTFFFTRSLPDSFLGATGACVLLAAGGASHPGGMAEEEEEGGAALEWRGGGDSTTRCGGERRQQGSWGGGSVPFRRKGERSYMERGEEGGGEPLNASRRNVEGKKGVLSPTSSPFFLSWSQTRLLPPPSRVYVNQAAAFLLELQTAETFSDGGGDNRARKPTLSLSRTQAAKKAFNA